MCYIYDTVCTVQEALVHRNEVVAMSNDKPVPTVWLFGILLLIRDASGEVLICHKSDEETWELPGASAEMELLVSSLIKKVRKNFHITLDAARISFASIAEELSRYSKDHYIYVVFTYSVEQDTVLMTAPESEYRKAEFLPFEAAGNRLDEIDQRLLKMVQEGKAFSASHCN